MATCTLVNHNKNPIIGICFHHKCNSQAAVCKKCVMSMHKTHSNQILALDQIDSFLNQHFDMPQLFHQAQQLNQSVRTAIRDAEAFVMQTNYQSHLTQAPKNVQNLLKFGQLLRECNNDLRGYLFQPYQNIDSELMSILMMIQKTKEHTQNNKSLLQIVINKFPINLEDSNLKCQIHDSYLSAFCLNQNCNHILVCTKCTTSEHKGHLKDIRYFDSLDFKNELFYQTIHQQLEEYKENILKKLAQIEKNFLLISKVIQNYQNHPNSINSLSQVGQILKLQCNWNNGCLMERMEEQIDKFNISYQDQLLKKQQIQREQEEKMRAIELEKQKKEEQLEQRRKQIQLQKQQKQQKLLQQQQEKNRKNQEQQEQQEKQKEQELLKQQKEQEIHNLYNQAEQLEKDHKINEALLIYDQIINLDSQNAKAYLLKGQLYDYKQQFEESIKCYDQALLITPDDYIILNNKGSALGHLKQYTQAIECYKLVNKLNPTYAKGYYNHGIQYHEQDQVQEAIQLYDKALQLEPNLIGALSNIGSAYDILGQYSIAIEYFNKALQIKPNNPIVLNNKGLSLESLKQYDQAISHYNQALSIAPNYMSCRHNLEILQARLKNKKK